MFPCTQRERYCEVGSARSIQDDSTSRLKLDDDIMSMKSQVSLLTNSCGKLSQEVVALRTDLLSKIDQHTTVIADLMTKLQRLSEAADTSQKQVQDRSDIAYQGLLQTPGVASNNSPDAPQRGSDLDGRKVVKPVFAAVIPEENSMDFEEKVESRLVPLKGRMDKLTDEFAAHTSHVQGLVAQMDSTADDMRNKVDNSIKEIKACIEEMNLTKVEKALPNGNAHFEKPSQENVYLDAQDTPSKLYENGSVPVETADKLEHLETEGHSEDPEYEFGASLWDAALFMGGKAFGAAGSLQILVLLSINVTVQLIYAFLIWQQFTESSFGDDTIADLKKFRINTAQSYKNVEEISFQSLATRVCKLDESLEIAGYQVEKLAAIEGYLPEDAEDIFGDARGQVMCTLSVLVWSLVVAKELKVVWHQLLVVLKHVYNFGCEWDKQELSQLVFVDGVWKMEAFCLFRVGLSVILSAFRLFVAIFLYVAGIQYLVHTIDLRDLVLNAVALECVLLLDELMFEALAPWMVFTVMGKVAPLPLPRRCVLWGLDAVAATLFLTVAFCMTFIFRPLLATEVKQLLKAKDALCDGRRDFVYARSKLPPFIMFADSNAGAGELSWDRKVVESYVFGGASNYQSLNMRQLIGGAWSVEEISSWSSAEASAKFNIQCLDILFSQDTFSRSAGQYIGGPSGPVDVQSCDQLKEFCDNDDVQGRTTRSLCPHTCGCGSPLSKLLMTSPKGGCPPQCMTTSSYVEALASIPCVDRNVSELNSDDGWVYYANRMVEIAVAVYPPGPVALTRRYRTALLTNGCEGVAILRNNGTFSTDFCDESPIRAWPFRSLRRFCPVTCGCFSGMLNCPGTCPASTPP